MINIVYQIENLNCKYLEIRYFNCLPIGLLILLDELLKIDSIVHSINIIIDQNFTDISFLEDLAKTNLRLKHFTVYNAKKNNSVALIENFTFLKHDISTNLHCGKIKKEYFSPNISTYTESQQHNTCLNRKISIDKDGNIKNCPSMPQSFGNIKDTTLEEALNHKDFKKYWNVNKDMIAVCKDCEFRHICTDCRAYTERTDFEDDVDLSKPLKCGYNPYTNVWEEWSTNPLKQKAIEYYGMQDLIKKK